MVREMPSTCGMSTVRYPDTTAHSSASYDVMIVAGIQHHEEMQLDKAGSWCFAIVCKDPVFVGAMKRLVHYAGMIAM